MLPLDIALLNPGLRLAVGVSGGADSVALLRALHQARAELGLVLNVLHLHHGLRGSEADQDESFVRELAAQLGLPFQRHQVDTRATAAAEGRTIEEAARHLRYAWFRELMAAGSFDAVATAHTLDDQAETVLAKFLRGAWTEGLAGIHPMVRCPVGRIVRPLLRARRSEVEAFLAEIGQTWREDSTNRQTTYTRNRIRHELLPQLENWNPQLKEHLANMAELARDEESYWSTEVARVAAQILLPGRPVRGGGRASGEGIALDLTPLLNEPEAMQRRVLRYAIQRLGLQTDFPGTEALRQLALNGRAGQRCELAGGLRGERTHRELRLSVQPPAPANAQPAEYSVGVPGEVTASRLGVHIRILADPEANQEPRVAILRPWKPGDRVHLRFSSGPRKVKEVLERMKISGPARAEWPVLELGGRILWMQGVTLEPEPGVVVQASPIGGTDWS